MNCHCCPYQKQIDALRAKCLKCNPDSDSGTPHGRVRADEFTLNAVPKAVDFDRTPTGQATNLRPSDEHKLRMSMAALFQLDPLDLLIVQQLMQGKTLDECWGAVDALTEASSKYRGSKRQMIWARKSGIIRKLPMLATVLKTDRENDTVTRIIKEIESNAR